MCVAHTAIAIQIERRGASLPPRRYLCYCKNCWKCTAKVFREESGCWPPPACLPACLPARKEQSEEGERERASSQFKGCLLYTSPSPRD